MQPNGMGNSINRVDNGTNGLGSTAKGCRSWSQMAFVIAPMVLAMVRMVLVVIPKGVGHGTNGYW